MNRLVSATLLFGVGLSFGQANHPAPKRTNPGTTTNEGERLFEVNCGRCHRPPDQLSPKITGSVLRHMRVRATLTQEDQQKILKYLAP